MSNFHQVIEYLSTFSSNERKGKAFELYCRWFLKNEPRYALQIKEVWLWKDWPENWGIEKGIDLIAETHSGEFWAIQAKAYDDNYYITKEDVDTFLSESARKKFSFRLLIGTTDNIGPNAREAMNGQEKPVGLCLLNSLESAALEWPLSLEDLVSICPKQEIKKPFAHQEEAINKILVGFQNSDRGQLHMACGTGKTLVGLWVAQQLQSHTTLVLVPSISLVSQLYHEWAENSGSDFAFDPIFICSDQTVDQKDDEQDLAIAKSELGFPITTDAQELLTQLSQGTRPKVVFSTYHSSPVIAQACVLNPELNFDLAIADEAHRCAGSAKSDFSIIAAKDSIRARYRLFMTATPKIFSDHVKQKTKEVEYEIASMDDAEKFGPVFHTFSFSEAIKQNLLSDYQVVISVMDNVTYREYADKGRIVSIENNHETDARTLASQLLIAKVIKEYGLKRIISFHNRKKAAREFIDSFSHALSLLPQNEKPEVNFKGAIFGDMQQSERRTIIKRFEEISANGAGLLANVKCLSEGVDVPTLDGIAFIDPKGSEIDIVQSVGRAIRKAPDKKMGTIIIPVFVDAASDGVIDLDQSCFKVVWKVVKALRAHDDVLAEELDTIRLELGKRIYKKSPKLSKIIFDVPVYLNSDFAELLQIKIVEICSSSWFFYYGLLQQFKELHHERWPVAHELFLQYNLGNWCGRQRQAYKNKKRYLTSFQIDLLSHINFPWEFKIDWDIQLNHLIEFRKLFPTKWPEREDEFPEGNKLGSWCKVQRGAFKRKTLENTKIEQLNSIEFVWDPIKADWDNQYNNLKKFREINTNRWPAQDEEFPIGNMIGRWCDKKRQAFKNNKLKDWQITGLNSLNFIWEPVEEEWRQKYQYLIAFRKVNPNRWPKSSEEFPKGNNLGGWCVTRRQAFKNNKLLKIQIDALNDIGFVWGDKKNWNDQFQNLQEFRNLNPSRWPQYTDEYPKGNKLGIWCANQRKSFSKKSLNQWFGQF